MTSGLVERMPAAVPALATDGLISYERNGVRRTVAFGLQDVHEFLPCLHAGDEVRGLLSMLCCSARVAPVRLGGRRALHQPGIDAAGNAEFKKSDSK